MSEEPAAPSNARGRALHRAALRGETLGAAGETPGPLPVLGWLGFSTALATFSCVLVGTFDEGLSRDGGVSIGSSSWAFSLWSVIYAGGLVVSWWLMRPRANVQNSYGVGAGVLWCQGLAYLAFWLPFATVQFPVLDLFVHDTLMGLWVVSAIASLIGALLVGPLFGTLVVFATLRGGFMCATQWFGALGLLGLFAMDA